MGRIEVSLRSQVHAISGFFFLLAGRRYLRPGEFLLLLSIGLSFGRRYLRPGIFFVLSVSLSIYIFQEMRNSYFIFNAYFIFRILQLIFDLSFHCTLFQIFISDTFILEVGRDECDWKSRVAWVNIFTRWCIREIS